MGIPNQNENEIIFSTKLNLLKKNIYEIGWI